MSKCTEKTLALKGLSITLVCATYTDFTLERLFNTFLLKFEKTQIFSYVNKINQQPETSRCASTFTKGVATCCIYRYSGYKARERKCEPKYTTQIYIFGRSPSKNHNNTTSACPIELAWFISGYRPHKKFSTIFIADKERILLNIRHRYKWRVVEMECLLIYIFRIKRIHFQKNRIIVLLGKNVHKALHAVSIFHCLLSKSFTEEQFEFHEINTRLISSTYLRNNSPQQKQTRFIWNLI